MSTTVAESVDRYLAVQRAKGVHYTAGSRRMLMEAVEQDRNERDMIELLAQEIEARAGGSSPAADAIREDGREDDVLAVLAPSLTALERVFDPGTPPVRDRTQELLEQAPEVATYTRKTLDTDVAAFILRLADALTKATYNGTETP